MASPPDRFRAHDRGRSRFFRKIDKSRDSFSKIFRFHVIGVAAERFVAPGRVLRIRVRFASSAKLWKVLVANPGRAQRLRQRLPAKLRITLRTGKHPHVRNGFNSILFQGRKEHLDLARRMPNCPNAGDHFWLFCFHEVPSYVSVPINKRK